MTGPTRASQRAAADVPTVLVWAVVAAVVSIALAPLGAAALYVVVGLIAVGVAGYLLRDVLRDPLMAGIRRIVPADGSSGRGASDLARPAGHELPRARAARQRVRTGAVLAVAGVGSAVLAWVVAPAGTKGVLVLVAVVVVGVLLALLWPLVVDVVVGPVSAPARRASRVVRDAYRDHLRVGAPARRAGAAGVLVAGAVGAGIAWIAAGLGTTGLLVVAGVIVLAGLVRFVRDRTAFFSFVAVCSLAFLMHKSFGPQDLAMSGGAISVYVTTFDVVLALLYAFWIREGTFRADLRAAMREPVIWFPLVGVFLLLPSLLVAERPLLSLAELVRIAWMYALFVYVAVRVRTRRHIWVILGALAVFVVVELVVVVLQWRTGGVLGLSFLGVPTVLGNRVTDTGTLGRPFGTIIHPVFMAAALGTVGMVALAFAIELKRSLTKVTAICVVLACFVCMWISDTRASVVAAAMAGVVVVGAGIVRGRLTWRTLGRIGLGVVVAGLVFFPVVSQKFATSFQTGHFMEEVQSRLQLNDIAGRMIGDHLALGVGLNNFEIALPAYEANPVIFFGNPVHNLYLLVLAETGVVGFVGVILVGVGLYDVAIRLGRSRDRLLGTLGIGVAGAMGFLMVEELLGFSLRQDVPLALYWLLGGLVVAGARMQSMAWPALHRGAPVVRRVGGEPGRRRRALTGAFAGRGAMSRRRRRTVVMAAAFGLLVTPSAGSGLPTALAAPSTVTGTTAPALVFSAVERATGVQGIFTANADGTGVQRITPADGRFYSWPRWAFGNTRVVYTVRSGPAGSPEAIAIMKPDGSDPQTLQAFDFRVAQPMIDPTGRWLVFTAAAPWFPQVAVFRMDLATEESTNLTARTVPLGGFDSDPVLTPRADAVVFVWTRGSSGSAISEMTADGTSRRQITDDRWFNTDPGVSPDGATIAIASYRGSGSPSTDPRLDPLSVKPGGWNVVVSPRSGGSERVLTAGLDCSARPPSDPCTVAEMSGFVPRFTPDGTAVTFTGALDSTTTCICSIGLGGANPRAILTSSTLAIDWYDWSQPPGASTSTAGIGTAVPTSRMLVVMTRPDGTRGLMSASVDLMHRTDIPLPGGLQPLDARWGPDRNTIVFTAEVATGPPRAPHPPAPPGMQRRAHVTLDAVDPVATALRQQLVASQPANLAERQVFLRNADGTVQQLTDPWTEDWRDGLATGDMRANSDPVMTPDGRYVIVTNTSTTTGESFLLRIDLTTGAVLNLTNGTAGAVPTDDSEASLSPDGSRIAFSWTQGTLPGVYVMDTATGTHVSAMTSSSLPTSMPAWAPDGRSLAYVSERADGPTVVTAPVGANLATGAETVVGAGLAYARHPVVAPEGGRLVFLAASGNVFGLYSAPVGGGATPQLVQPDVLHSFLDVDWR